MCFRCRIQFLFGMGLFFLAILPIGTTPICTADEVDVYLLGGQSNMQGIGFLKDLNESQLATPSNVFFWTGEVFEALVPGKSQTSLRKGEFGPEIGFAQSIAGEKPVYLIKYAVGGQPLHHGWDGNKWVGGEPVVNRKNFYPGENTTDPNVGTLYRNMRDRAQSAIQNLKDAGHSPTVRGFVWMQGEQDSKHVESAQNYAVCLRRLRDRVGQDLQTEDLAFAFGRVLPHEPALPKFVSREIIGKQMSDADMGSGSAYALPRSRCVSTTGLGMRDDTVHYDAAGQLELGIRFAAAIKWLQTTAIDMPVWAGAVPGFTADYDHQPPKQLSPGHISEVTNSTLRYFPASEQHANGRSVLVIPGGGYHLLADEKEGDRVAAFLADQGFASFTLRYRVSKNGGPPFQFPGPLYDARQAMRIIKSRADEFGIKADQLGVMGYSAGGHLASMCATRFDDEIPGELLGGGDGSSDETLSAVSKLSNQSVRPAFAALIYPVATMMEGGHGGSRQGLFGSDPKEADLIAASPERRMVAQSSPLFIVHNEFDRVESLASLQLAIAAKKAQVPCELHMYPTGQHGFGMGQPGETNQTNPAIDWPELFLRFLRR